MPEPIYSRRYPKEEKNGRANDTLTLDAPPEGSRGLWEEEKRRDMIFARVVEVTNRNRCDVDIFKGSGTLFVKIYLDVPRVISDLDGMLSMACAMAISDAKDGHGAVLSIIYDL